MAEKMIRTYILIKGLPVCQFDGISETTTVGYRFPYGIAQCEYGEKYHEWKQQPGCSLYRCIEKQGNSQYKFKRT